jgi:hypothetical protein
VRETVWLFGLAESGELLNDNLLHFLCLLTYQMSEEKDKLTHEGWSDIKDKKRG